MKKLVTGFRESRAYPRFSKYLDESGRQTVAALAERIPGRIPDSEAGSDYHTIGVADCPILRLAGRGAGNAARECLILLKSMLKSAREALEQNRLLDAVVLAAQVDAGDTRTASG